MNVRRSKWDRFVDSGWPSGIVTAIIALAAIAMALGFANLIARLITAIFGGIAR